MGLIVLLAGDTMNQPKSYTTERTLKFAIVDQGKIISKHIDFYNSQCTVERHLRNNKISNNYEIKPLREV